MFFNSIEFFIFLPIVFALYWFVFSKNLNLQNLTLLLASYVFYGWWDWRFLLLLMFSTGLDYFTGLKIYAATSDKRKKQWLLFSVLANLGFLAFFKYFNFFIDSLAYAFAQLGYKIDTWTLNLILPVGISFYTFHGLSYVIDIYKKACVPTRNWVNYSVFVSYFPLLVAGPIERATHLLPQVERTRSFSYKQSVDGIWLILWGLFKKIVIADQLAPIVNDIFSNSDTYPSSLLILGAFYFSFQIYGDFSGYSDIARGVSKLFGIELLLNFKFPYFSRSIPEFWKKWHISLSSWFRDYLYIPLGGSKGSRLKTVRNVFIIFLVSGFWHGANWTFIVWGLIHALLFLPSLLLRFNTPSVESIKPRNHFLIKDIPSILFTFVLVTFAWIFFRAVDVSHAFSYISRIFVNDTPHFQYLNPYNNLPLFKENIYIVLFLGIDFLIQSGYLTLKGLIQTRTVKALAILFLIYAIMTSIQLNSENAFIYFQF